METNKQTYVKPSCKVIATDGENLLQASGNAGKIGAGGSAGDAKQGWLEEEEGAPTQVERNHSAWEE